MAGARRARTTREASESLASRFLCARAVCRSAVRALRKKVEILLSSGHPDFDGAMRWNSTTTCL
ncbi:hypothetical protein BSIN_3983 [Burkholderia singularis]|uniref:Uncharacterized protein n=1 Tax=Burkholderia singularis TaxID=1503053 RepID=A0A238H6X6_9BURK|nr:hypothetical protein BSIN_3983 [Burkholderia singularis]